MKLKLYLKQQINQNRWQYLIITSIFIIGMLMGYYKIPGLEVGVKEHLGQLLNNYLQGTRAGSLNGYEIFINAVISQSKSVVLIWFLGLTIIGFPLILVVVFLRGYSLGFTLGFLIQEKAVSGILIGILTIVPQNMVYIPFIIIWSVVAVNFSLGIVRQDNQARVALGRQLLLYSMGFIFFLVLFMLGAFIEAFLSPWFLSLFL